ncbi:MAG: DUF4402 domain-containing protein [Lutibacter sp.]|nr:DUF4402 domain-containing protein [Lutibacter sp.]
MIHLKRNTLNLLQLLLYTTVFLFITNLAAQPALPNRQITVLPTQPIDFGVFVVNGGGTIKVDYQGNLTTVGVISINTTTVTPAIFEIKLCQGRNVTIVYDYSVMLNGSNGGQLELIIGPTEKGISGDEFPVDNNCDFITILRVGGTLVVPSNAVPGVYIGSFPITFTQE